MAVKKTELYSSLWASCDALRGGMDASQYKDYILTLLFMKYVTDKYKGQKYGDLIVFDKANDPNPDPEKRTGCSFDDFIALKNKKNIGEGIDKIIARLAEVNEGLKGVIDIAHFNDETKIGKNKEMVDKLTKLISIFQRPELDFSKNKAEGDDIIGDAYEYLMRNFASESGKSKGQFYTPAEVSRILAKIIGIDKCSDHDATVCDPACGSGSLLIRALEEAPFEISGYGQEKDSSTAGLAKMNAVLHNKATIKIMAGNTFSDPQFKKAEDASELERFDYIVANPPFSLKNWADGLKEFGRFSGYGDRPPEKNGDYAWLMHILKTLKSTGKAAVILPHGVLFRGNAEATIRQKIIDKGWIKGIISLPPNLFYGTGIPACIIVIDKEGAKNRSGIFMIDASKGYIKEGSKNRLREQDIYRIVTTFNEKITTDPKYARFVLNKEIKGKNEYNLNISRYIDSSDSEDIQDIYAHIHGGIPIADIDALEHFWKVFPSLKDELFDVFSEGYYKLNVEEDVIRQTIYSNEEFIAYGEKIDEAFSNWRNYADAKLKNLRTDISTKDLIVKLAQSILREFEDLSLINKYDVYQILLAYWNEELSDDVSMIISDEAGYGAARKTENIMKETKKFGNSINDEEDNVNKVKTALLIIQKDFEAKVGFSPINVRPIPLFSMGFFAIDLKNQKKLLRKYPDCLEQIEESKNICRVQLDKIWRNDYKKYSFPKFKYLLYSKDKELDINSKIMMKSALCVSIVLTEDYDSRFKNIWNRLKGFIGKKVISGDYTAISEIEEMLQNTYDIRKYKAKAICEVIISSMDIYRKKFAKTTAPIVSEKAKKSGIIKYQFNVAVNSYFRWVERNYKKILSEISEGELYLINENGNLAKEISVVLGILEAFDVLNFKMIGGANSQLYIYINQILGLKNILNAPYNYENRLLDSVSERHLLSVKMLTYLYESDLSSEQIWDYIEDYFLGQIPEKVKLDCLQENPNIKFD